MRNAKILDVHSHLQILFETNLVAGMCCVKCIINIWKYSDFYNRGAAKFLHP